MGGAGRRRREVRQWSGVDGSVGGLVEKDMTSDTTDPEWAALLPCSSHDGRTWSTTNLMKPVQAVHSSLSSEAEMPRSDRVSELCPSEWERRGRGGLNNAMAIR